MFADQFGSLDTINAENTIDSCACERYVRVKEKCLNLYELLLNGYPNPADYLQNGYIMLPNSAQGSDSEGKLFAIDCEMVTTRSSDGILRKELARVSVINNNLDIVLDIYVLPEHEIIDYLTIYSGLTPRLMKHAKLKLVQIQKLFVELFDSSCIFVGHSLEQDLHILQIIHMKVIDTSVLYLRNFGGSKPKLKFLAAMNLNMLIQVGSGHNSTEDARCAMMLALRTLLPGETFDKNYSARGIYNREFFEEREKFLQIKIFPPDNCMSWMQPIVEHLREFTEQCQKKAKGKSSLSFKLYSYYFYIPAHETLGRLAVAFYVGVFSPGVYDFFEYREEFTHFKNVCSTKLHLETYCKVLYKNKLPSWTFNHPQSPLKKYENNNNPVQAHYYVQSQKHNLQPVNQKYLDNYKSDHFDMHSDDRADHSPEYKLQSIDCKRNSSSSNSSTSSGTTEEALNGELEEVLSYSLSCDNKSSSVSPELSSVTLDDKIDKNQSISPPSFSNITTMANNKQFSHKTKLEKEKMRTFVLIKEKHSNTKTQPKKLQTIKFMKRHGGSDKCSNKSDKNYQNNGQKQPSKRHKRIRGRRGRNRRKNGKNKKYLKKRNENVKEGVTKDL